MLEAFDVAVGLGPVGACLLIGDVAPPGVEQLRPVAGSVIAEDTFGGDPVGGVEDVGATLEGGRGLLSLDGDDLGIGELGVVINGRMQKELADRDNLLSVLPPDRAPWPAPTTTVGNAAEPVHVDMHQVTRICVFAAERVHATRFRGIGLPR